MSQSKSIQEDIIIIEDTWIQGLLFSGYRCKNWGKSSFESRVSPKFDQFTGIIKQICVIRE